MSNSLWPHGLHSPWNSLGQNTGVGSLSFLQGIFPTQGSNPGFLHCRQILYQLSYEGSPLTLTQDMGNWGHSLLRLMKRKSQPLQDNKEGSEAPSLTLTLNAHSPFPTCSAQFQEPSTECPRHSSHCPGYLDYKITKTQSLLYWRLPSGISLSQVGFSSSILNTSN